jgi:hypothetical protein
MNCFRAGAIETEFEKYNAEASAGVVEDVEGLLLK